MRKTGVLAAIIVLFAALCIFSACDSEPTAFNGTYESLWGNSDIVIDGDEIKWGEITTSYTVDGNVLTFSRANGSELQFRAYENGDVLVLGEASEFDSGPLTKRDGYLSGSLVNYSGGGVGEQFTFSSDGTFSYIEVATSGGTLQYSGSYKLSNGVLYMRGTSWSGKSITMGFYISESYEMFINVYVRNLDRFQPEPPDPVINYENTDVTRGELKGVTRQQLGEGETGTPVTAVAREGYTFTQWSDGRTDNPRTDSNLEESTTVYAEFEPIFDIVFETEEGGRIVSGETQQQIIGDGVTSPVTIEVQPGYTFLGWDRMEDDSALTAEIDTSEFNLKWHTGEAYRIVARFEKIVYTAIYDSEQGGYVNGTTGTLTFEVDYEDGYTAPKVTATPITETDGSGYYVFVGWSDGVKEATRQDVLTEDIRVVALFEHYFTVTFTAERGGHLEGDLEQHLTGDNFTATTVTAIPDEGWAFDGWWTRNGGIATYDPSITHHKGDNAMGGDAEYTAKFRWLGNTYILSYDKATDGGRLRGDTYQEAVIEGDRGTPVEAVPDEGYVFVRWSDGRTDNPRTDVATSNLFVDAIFVREELMRQFTLTYAAGTGGSIVGETSQTVQYGESGTAVTAVPEEGYEFVRWSDGVTTATRTDGNVTSDITVTAEFRRIELTLTYAAGTGGSIIGETSQTVQYGESGTAVTAVPEEGYEFVRWSDGVTTATRTDDNVTSDIIVTAEFRRIELTLTYAAGTGGSIVGETSQTVQYGESGTAVTAVPEEGYEFVRWSDGVTTATRADDNVTSDITVTAEFRVENTTDFAGGIGTTEHPYEVATFKHLRNMELYPDAHYVLTADIVLSEAGEGGSNFAPLFSDEMMFGGTLDGQGHKISNLTVYNTETFYSGLFSCISASGSVTNLVLENASVSGTNFIGGIAGYTLGAVTDCTVTGSITYLGGNGYKVFAGGIAGRAEASVDGCVTDVTVTVEDAQAETNVGGIVGYLAYSGSQSEPMTLAADGSVTVSASGAVYAGGLIGRSSVGLYISDSYATGNVTSTSTGSNGSSYAGGLVGSGDSTVTDSYATGDVTSTSTGSNGSSYAGGLVGHGDLTVTDSYATGDVTSTSTSMGSYGHSYAGGLVGYGKSIVTDSYATGDVTSTSTSGNFSYSYAGGLVGCGDLTVTDSYAMGNVTSAGDDSHAGGLVGSGDSTVTDSYAMGNVTSAGDDSHAGGLVGRGDLTVTDSYATGDVTSTSTSSNGSSYAGGLVGNGDSTVTDSYATGDVTSTSSNGSSYAGGLVGDGNSVTVRNSYSVSCVSAESESGNVYIGGIAGYVDSSLTLENAHWYGGDGTAAEYAVGYSDSLGIPTNIGSTRHNSVEEFHTLADTLNAGREEPVWEHKGEDTLPTLIEKTQESE